MNGSITDFSNRAWEVSVPLGEGNNTLTAVGVDVDNTIGTDSIQVTLDTTAPIVACNAPAFIDPTDALDEDDESAAPIAFTATAADACDSDPIVAITEFECFKLTKKGRRVDKMESCQWAHERCMRFQHHPERCSGRWP